MHRNLHILHCVGWWLQNWGGNGVSGEKRAPSGGGPRSGPRVTRARLERERSALRHALEFRGVDIIFKRICLSVTVIWMTKLSPHNYPYRLCLTKLFQQLLLLVKQKPDIFFSGKICMHV